MSTIFQNFNPTRFEKYQSKLVTRVRVSNIFIATYSDQTGLK